ncbi:hypothetical protein [Methylopila sp. Yamaguchi]|uniref:hypothetical protein n=1 Tax=Methylopila sp. Yamaguchi TaxID=1437817 RepID=UPI00135AFFE4|nr:hypothetical protein [Methylopila sp. Yamaguchi]
MFIAMARVGGNGVVYLSGVTDGGSASTSNLFFAHKKGEAIEVLEIDSGSKINSRAKKLCDTHGFQTPIPG